MPDTIEETLSGTVDRWLADFERAVSGSDPASLENLFLDDSHWRDLLAFTWHIGTVSGAGDIAEMLMRRAGSTKAGVFETDRDRVPPRLVTRAGEEVIEAFFGFETAVGRARGILRLKRAVDGDAPRAWTLLTALDEMDDFPETVGKARPRGESYSRDFHGPNWLDQREASVAYADRDPAVLVVGGGQAGLSIAARLTQLGVDTLIVDREQRIGDNWRKRYHALTLHNQVQVNHLPYMPFPPSWPTYIPKDKLAGWFEAYTESMDLNFWTGVEFEGGAYDDQKEEWSVTLRLTDGTTREMHPRHVVMATGVSGVPNMPDIPSLKDFKGKIVHTGDYGDGSVYTDKRVLILGTGTSAHDVAQDLHARGAQITMIQRSPTLVINVEPSAQLPYALYDEGPSLEDCDLIAASTPYQLMKTAHQNMTAQAREMDKPLLEGLERAGFKMHFGKDGTGWQFMYLTRGGGYYFNVGCSELIVDGKVGVVQFDDVDRFVGDGALMRNGETLAADVIVLATGFKGQDYLVGAMFGDEVAECVGPVWGFDASSQELRNMWSRTGQPGLWFNAGSLAQCRIYSKYLALQIKAREEGLIPAARETS